MEREKSERKGAKTGRESEIGGNIAKKIDDGEGVAEIVRARRQGRESVSLPLLPSSLLLPARNRDRILRMAKAAGMVPAVLDWRTNARETTARDERG